MSGRRRVAAIASAVILLIGGAVTYVALRPDSADVAESPESTRSSATSTTSIPPTTTTTIAPFRGWSDPLAVGEPASDVVDGLLTFRGNPTRTFHGTGPIGGRPQRAWSFPESAMCSQSSEGNETTTWCGTGWTGQPAVFERDGRTWVVFGGYDRNVHFVDAATGTRIIPDFPTGDLIKGSVTIDPGGFPIVYVGSRDNRLRAIAFDRDAPVELWSLDANAVSPTMWNDDWDGSPLVIDDYLFEGGENSQLHIVKLNRRYDGNGLATVDPRLVFNAPGWDDELLAAIGDSGVSIESSVAIWRNTLYFANSGGLVQGWDIKGLKRGRQPRRVFRFWTGDDTDATVVVDEEGMLYVGSEYERHTPRSVEVGQVMKLDPTKARPIVWSLPARTVGHDGKAGIWATPALGDGVVYVATHGGELVALDRETGAVLWHKDLPAPLWQSPVVVDDTLVQGDCGGVLHAYDISDPKVDPPQRWKIEIGGCIESTPAAWKGMLYVGTRSGQFHAISTRRRAGA